MRRAPATALRTRGRHAEDGSILPWMLVTALLLVFLGGLSLDLWRGFAERRLLAGLVDTAAVIGSSAIDEELFRRDGMLRLDPALARRRAADYLRRHLDDPTLREVQVVATPDRIDVRAAATVNLTLSRLLLSGARPLRVRVHAAAEPRLGP